MLLCEDKESYRPTPVPLRLDVERVMSYCSGKVYAYCGGDFICISNHSGYWIRWPDGYEGDDEMVFYFPDYERGVDPPTTMTFPDLESFRQHIETHRLEFDRLSAEMTDVMHRIVEDQVGYRANMLAATDEEREEEERHLEKGRS